MNMWQWVCGWKYPGEGFYHLLLTKLLLVLLLWLKKLFFSGPFPSIWLVESRFQVREWGERYKILLHRERALYGENWVGHRTPSMFWVFGEVPESKPNWPALKFFKIALEKNIAKPLKSMPINNCCALAQWHSASL